MAYKVIIFRETAGNIEIEEEGSKRRLMEIPAAFLDRITLAELLDLIEKSPER